MPTTTFFAAYCRRAALALGLAQPQLTAAQSPVPAPRHPERRVLLRGGPVHVGDGGTVIESGADSFQGEWLDYVGPAASFPADRLAGVEVIDVTGQHVYPGLILANSTLGLTEIDAVRATVDERETGTFNPNVRSVVAYNTDSEILPTVRTNGVLTVQVTPRGGTISGQSSVVQLDAWNWEDAVVRADDGLHLNWPSHLPRTGIVPDSIITKRLKIRDAALRDLDQLFADARAYRAARPSSANLRLAGLDAVLAGRQTLYLHADGAKEIVEAVRWAKRTGIAKPVVVGAEGAAQVLDFLKDNGVAVVLGRLHSLPHRQDDDVDAPFRLPKLLLDAGIPFCFSYEGDMENPGARNLPFTAGTAVAYGLPPEQALYAMTGGAASILGLPQQGVLATSVPSTGGQPTSGVATGKLAATLVVSRGDLLDMRTNAVTYAFIQGRQIVLRNRQQQLAEKFGAKYKK
ncbi:MAG: amidohydrolase [Hymenobacteraceae bacterium]|nr:amidohydrolase [Hymenobacteraceae bacterium]